LRVKSKEYISEEGSMDYELEVTRKQAKFNEWMYSKFRPFLKGDILETGSGCGTFSEKIANGSTGKVCLSEIDENFIKSLKKEFEGGRVSVKRLNLERKEDFENLGMKFDSILCSNVLEHIKDDVLALKRMREILKPKGTLVLLVPCHKFLFSTLDVAEGHYRRYTKKELEEKVKRAGFKIKKSFWFNMMAIPGRFVNGNIFKSKKTHEGSFGLFNKLVPVLKIIEERIFRNLIGVSRIMILENPGKI
jgi:SAM-dependent methyltransferase